MWTVTGSADHFIKEFYQAQERDCKQKELIIWCNATCSNRHGSRLDGSSLVTELAFRSVFFPPTDCRRYFYEAVVPTPIVRRRAGPKVSAGAGCFALRLRSAAAIVDAVVANVRRPSMPTATNKINCGSNGDAIVEENSDSSWKKKIQLPPPRKKTRKEEIIKPRVRIKSWKKIAWEILSRFFFSFPHLALLRFIDHRVSRRAGRRTYRNPRPPLAQTVGETVKNLGGHHGQGSMETE